MAGCDDPLRAGLRDLAFVHDVVERIRSAADRVVTDPLSEDAGTALVPLLLIDAETARVVLSSCAEHFEVGA